MDARRYGVVVLVNVAGEGELGFLRDARAGAGARRKTPPFRKA